jgi:SAM-dependent methyltransferase
MTTEEAIRLLSEEFPFDGYFSRGTATIGSNRDIANTVQRFLEPGSRVLDFGCGPCDNLAILQSLGYQCSGYDDLQDAWHKIEGNREKIFAFAKSRGIDLRLAEGGELPFEKNSFDMVMLNDVIEHLHDSPRDLLNNLLELVRTEGLLLISVPNAVNIRKRIHVMFGKTNLPPFESYYWIPGSWRGHVREYVKDDLDRLAEYLNLRVMEIRGCDHMIEKLPRFAIPPYSLVTKIFQGWKDSWMFVAKKNPGWSPRKSLPEAEIISVMGIGNTYQFGDR